MFEIEKDVPLPTASIRRGITATLRAMEVGDSVLVPAAKNGTYCGFFHPLLPKKFCTRRQDGGQMRIWRLM